MASHIRPADHFVIRGAEQVSLAACYECIMIVCLWASGDGRKFVTCR